MNEAERKKFEEFVNAMSKEEMEIAVMNIDIDILWDGIRKRETAERNTVKAMKDLLVNGCV